MKKTIYLLLSIFSLGFIFSGCDDYDDVRSGNISVVGVASDSDKRYIKIEDNQTLQLETFVMPRDKASKVTFSLLTQTGAIEITPDGLVTPLVKTPPEGEIPSPLGIDTIMVTLDRDPGIFVVYPVRVYSYLKLVTSITLQSSGQFPEIEVGKTFNLAQYVTVNPSDATDKTVTYSSEDESIVTVDQNGIITAVGEAGQSTTITITANDRAKQSTQSVVTIAAEPPLYLTHPVSDKWLLTSNLEANEGDLKNLLDDKNSTFWAPKILKRPIYEPECWLDIDFSEVIKFGQLGYRHRSLNYSHLQCHTFTLQGKKSEADPWTELGEFVTEALQVDKYQLFPVENPMELKYLRINFIKGYLKSGATDWNYSDAGNVSVGDLEVYIYNR
ncbi:MAG: Ig-like domain-containing protein [Bacteroides sp.]|nr:Ig-like domain-containing protein [Bacteroides sp.]